MLTYTLARQESALSIGNGAPDVFTEADISARGADRLQYIGPAGNLAILQPGRVFGSLPLPLDYTLLVVRERSTKIGLTSVDGLKGSYITGTATLPADIPATGIVDHYMWLLADHIGPPSVLSQFQATNVRTQINRATGMIEATITASDDRLVDGKPAASLQRVTLNFTGQLDARTGRLNGSVNSPEGFSGRFVGRLYGPAGREFGFAFTATRGTEHLVGTVIGIQV